MPLAATSLTLSSLLKTTASRAGFGSASPLVTGLSPAAQAFAAAATAATSPVVLIVPSDAGVEQMTADARFFCGALLGIPERELARTVLPFPSPEVDPYRAIAPHLDVASARARALAALAQGTARLVVGSAPALLPRVSPPQRLLAATQELVAPPSRRGCTPAGGGPRSARVPPPRNSQSRGNGRSRHRPVQEPESSESRLRRPHGSRPSRPERPSSPTAAASGSPPPERPASPLEPAAAPVGPAASEGRFASPPRAGASSRARPRVSGRPAVSFGLVRASGRPAGSFALARALGRPAVSFAPARALGCPRPSRPVLAWAARRRP